MSNTTVVTSPPCQLCHKTSDFTLDAEKVERWRAGEFIQDVFPELTANQREQIISGVHPKCWDILFPDDEDQY
jgi:hypothetical protein